MFPYWFLFSVFAAGTLQYGRRITPGVQAVPFLTVAGLLVVVLVGFRFETGADWDTYVQLFDTTRYLDFDDVISMGDPGYMLINWVTQAVGLDVWFVNLIGGLIFSFGLITFAKNQPNPWLATLVAVPYLIIVVAMGYSRQGIAIGLIMAGLTALEKQSIVRFGIYIILAATFHKTAVLILPLVALTGARHRFVTGLLLAVMGYFLYNWFLEASMDRFVTNYIEGEYSSQGAAIRVAMNLVPAALFLLFQKRFDISAVQRKLWRNFSYAAFGLAVLLYFLPSSTVVDRVALYVIPLQLFVLSRIPDVFPNKDGTRNGQLVLLVIFYSAAVQFVWLNYATHARYWIPYQLYPFFSGSV